MRRDKAGYGEVRQVRCGSVRRGTIRFGWARQANFKEINMDVMKAEALAEERKLLEKIANKNGGLLMVDDVLDEARNPTSILHKHFQWDDDKAAEAYRKMQARQLIQKCVVTIEKAPDPTSVAHVQPKPERGTSRVEAGRVAGRARAPCGAT